ncbi:MAG: Ig domain-containing protein [Verrucomicrobiota bacterium]|nr:Ig domain-containing protein [Verrucomicrobiota bacterium]
MINCKFITRRCIRSTIIGVLSLALLSNLAEQSAIAATYTWNTLEDTYGASDMDLRSMNETVAGQSGWITIKDGHFYTGDDKPIRFWGVTNYATLTLEQHKEKARFLAKRGVNLCRTWKSVFDNTAPTMDSVNMDIVSDIQRAVYANKREGIYTEISHFFILGFKIQASWGVDGYTKEWITANKTGAGSREPFGLLYFDDTFKSAVKRWIEVILTTPNPYENDKHALKDDTSIALLEIINEDSMFFYTFDPTQYPPEQQKKLYKLFGNFLVNKYGSLNAALTSWKGTALANDDLANGIMVVQNASAMSGLGNTTPASLRINDQVDFLGKLQHDFYAEMTAYIRSLGYGGPVTGSNWRTSDYRTLQDLEYYTYTGAGVMDSHSYFDPYQYNNPGGDFAGVGDSYYGVPVVQNPRRCPTAIKTVEGFPSIVSENTWVNPTNLSVEAPLVVATFAKLRSIDGWIWFGMNEPKWSASYDTWPIAKPSILGQFPGAAMIYRRGDVASASTLVREGRTYGTIVSRKTNSIRSTFGWDITRDPAKVFNYNPITQQGDIDPAAMLVGGVDMAFDDDSLYVSEQLSELIDNTNKTLTSATHEVVLDYNKQILTINTPRSQAAVGYLRNQGGDIVLDDIIIRAGPTFTFGSILVTALDGMPLSQSTKLLIQAGTQDNLTGFASTPANVNGYSGETIQSVGNAPWVCNQVDARVLLRKRLLSEVVSIKPMNANGYPSGAPIAAATTTPGTRITLPTDALYTIVTLTPPTKLIPVIITKNLPNTTAGITYTMKLEAISGSGNLSWSVTSGTLPSRMTLSTDGVLSGQSDVEGTTSFTIQVTDADGNSSTQDFILTTLPYSKNSFFEAKNGTYRTDAFLWNASVGFMYDGFHPFVWLYNRQGWIYIFGAEDTKNRESDGYFLYDFTKETFGYTTPAYYPYYYVMSGSDYGQVVDLSK